MVGEHSTSNHRVMGLTLQDTLYDTITHNMKKKYPETVVLLSCIAFSPEPGNVVVLFTIVHILTSYAAY